MIRSKQHRLWIIVTLGFLSAMNPLSTDMYMPAFQEIGRALHVTTASLSLTLSSYLIGIAVGQIIYGPLLDRYGRKKPLYGGILLYILASIGCIFTRTLYLLVFWRFLTAVGGCVATVASVAMVRDLFTVKESGKIFSLLMLVLGVSPLLAPTIGSVVAVNIGWQGVFVILIFLAVLMILSAALILPESHAGDPSVQLTPGPLLSNYWRILIYPQFAIYSFVGGASIATLFAYIAASPILLFNFFHVSVYGYGCIFTLLAIGFISGSQVNIFLLRRFESLQILRAMIFSQIFFCFAYVLVAWMNCLYFPIIFCLLFMILLSIGCALPNAAVLAMAPFANNAGRASALLNSSQMILGTIASVLLGLIEIKTMLPIAWIFLLPALLAGICLYCGRKVPLVLCEEENDQTVLSFH